MGQAVETNFDQLLLRVWKKAESNGACKYKLKLKYKRVPGEKGIIIQCNTQRTQNRRPPQSFTSVSMPFDKNKFNFTKVKSSEILFQIHKEQNGKSPCLEFQENFDANGTWKDTILVNDSPFAPGHVLLVPRLSDSRPQILTQDAVQLALEIQLLSESPQFITVFNSMCARASVNHLHLHSYYLNLDSDVANLKKSPELLIQRELMASEQISKQCYVCEELPLPALVFQVITQTDVIVVAEAVNNLVEYFISRNIPHNISIARGPPIKVSGKENENSDCDVIKLFLWPRALNDGNESYTPTRVGACELSGQFFMPESNFDSTTEEQLLSWLTSAMLAPDTFKEIVDYAANVRLSTA